MREACEIVDVNLFDVKFKTLGEIAKDKLEYGSGASAVEYNDKVRYIRITDIDDFGNLKSEKVSPSKIEEKYYLDYGDILFARSGATVGKNFIYKDNQKAIFAGYLIRLKVNEKVANPKYVYNCLNTTSYKNFIFRKKGMSSKPNINAKQYSEFKIPVPPFPLNLFIFNHFQNFTHFFQPFFWQFFLVILCFPDNLFRLVIEFFCCIL